MFALSDGSGVRSTPGSCVDNRRGRQPENAKCLKGYKAKNETLAAFASLSTLAALATLPDLAAVAAVAAVAAATAVEALASAAAVAAMAAF